MNKGTLNYKNYINLVENKLIKSPRLNINQIQPSSIDLTLSEECYEISASFLAHKNKVKDRLNQFVKKNISLENGFVLKKGTTYLIKLNEKLFLKNNLFGKCNPKSSTGRLDIFCRTILDNSDEYEKIPFGYNGDIYLEVTSRAFNIFVKKGESLNQMRLVNLKKNTLSDNQLLKYHKKDSLVYNKFNKAIDPIISTGIKIGIDLKSSNNICAYKAKKNAPLLYFNKVRHHEAKNFWEIVKTKNNMLTLLPGEFFILKSKQKIKIPNNMAGEMIPYDTGIGDFRAHYAGFFDPGFGNINGSFAVLEIRTNEVPFNLMDGQIVAKIIYERLNKSTNIIYGKKIKSNYQNQGLALSKHFNIMSK
tara:strand:+ start:146 stop:1231 length:1086 start_codon:yes stop_codon:yes gene_type:complete